ncbi:MULTISPECIES: sigma-70 family RNA polymerase sigma factor [unclassified Rubrivivax]|uniref:sigma-70 family RNA polymerase sigma factor n=1 Tax=unclassified Rubrivivax TaxID=2649762 RepID=UPI001E3786E8|nr:MULTISPECIES: sigma-70 family RNA polymerase sigma factor [unclassified Rubrivivax]MCC9597823.1 sigma-70 family RNA polymerase sigma factor [Rubrivivax sp. JA1055]MCC9645920.1 sigma-70 family RNA polymerase sigma factor [Rubrivivax sp. JA1029]
MSSADVLQQQLQLLYRDHHGWLHAWLARKLGCPQHAADIAHDTFVRVIAARDALLGVQQPRAWLSTTATRLVIDEARRRRLEQAWLEELARAADGATYPSPEQTLAAVQALAQLEAVLETVPAKARSAFVRHYLDGQTHAVVAAELGVSTKMVQKYLARVLLQCHALQAA